MEFLLGNKYPNRITMTGTNQVRNNYLNEALAIGPICVRVVYYVLDEAMPLYALLIYGKGEQADLTPEQRKSVKAIAASLKDAHRKRRKNEQAR
jgi:hypothetical protein